MYGAQASSLRSTFFPGFENDVEMYGAQAKNTPPTPTVEFENDVEMYGAQACLGLFRH